MLQKQANYHDARFSFSVPYHSTPASHVNKLLQHCKYHPIPGSPLSDRATDQTEPLKFYLITQLYRLFITTPLSIEHQEFNEQKPEYPYYILRVHPRFLVTITQDIRNRAAIWLTAYYHSLQFDEYYSFANAYPPIPRPFNFFDPYEPAQLVCETIIPTRMTHIWRVQDYSATLIPQ
jgi:hypothetical protein